jgi:hypothetical protein
MLSLSLETENLPSAWISIGCVDLNSARRAKLMFFAKIVGRLQKSVQIGAKQVAVYRPLSLLQAAFL